MLRVLQKFISTRASIGCECEAKLRNVWGRILLMIVQKELPVAITRIGAGASQMLPKYSAIGWYDRRLRSG